MSTARPASIGLRAAVLCAVAAALAACGISADERVTHIPADDLGALANTTTTTTTTTTSTTTTVPATVASTITPASLPLETTTTSTIEVVQLEDVDIFYVPRGRDEVVKKVPLRQVGEPTLNDVIDLLADPPTQVLSDLTTEVTPGLVRSWNMLRLYTVVDLDREEFDRMSDSNQRQAIAQLVLTLTNFVTPDRGAIGAVVFTVGGEEIPIPIPELGASEPGEPITFSDFDSWVDTTPTDEPVPVTSAANTTAPPSTDPPPDATTPPG